MLNKLGKLLKYEFRFYFRILPPIYFIIILLALVIRLQGVPSNSFTFMPEQSLLGLLLGAIIITMSVITIILVIQRYTDNFLKDAGSLMFSLPVSVFALLSSKAIAALCMILFGSLSIMISVVINAIGTENWYFIKDAISNAISKNLKGIVFSATSGFFTLLQQICLFYTVITVSYMLPRFRNMAAFAMYFFVMFFIGQYTTGIIERSTENAMLFYACSSFVFAAIFFCTTWFLLKRSYNLE